MSNFALPPDGGDTMTCSMEVVYTDNHIIIVNKRAGELVQGDRTGDPTLIDTVKAWIKEKYDKPGTCSWVSHTASTAPHAAWW